MSTFIKRHWELSLACALAAIAIVLIGYRAFQIGTEYAATGAQLPWGIFIAIGILNMLLLWLYVLLLNWRTTRLRHQQMWVINTLNRHVQKMGEQVGATEAEEQRDPASSSWPWGGHHTESLGHLDAAARKWWVLYDPSDLTTAPTNEMVSDWLQSERKISREKARAIASMLRPDGLPTGPRK